MWKRNISVLLYHRVLKDDQNWLNQGMGCENFIERMKLLKAQYCTLSVDEARYCLEKNKIPRKAVVLTFDDGYLEHFNLGMSILADLKLPACFFIPTGYIGSTGMWSDKLVWALKHWGSNSLDLREFSQHHFHTKTIMQRQQVLEYLKKWLKYQPVSMQKIVIDYLFQAQRLPEIPRQMMSEKEIFMLHQAGFTIGSHTHTHPIFSQITLKQCQDELVHSKRILEKILEAPVSYFAYPNGVQNKDFQKEHQILVKKAGYDFAFSTSHGKLQGKTNVFACPRTHYLPSFLS